VNKELNLVLVGNPNSGKSSVFNQLTGLHQKVGNFPGVTVDKKSGWFSILDKLKATITDLPGLYSMYPNSMDESIAVDYILKANLNNDIDAVLYIADSTRLEQHLLLFSQLYDMGLPLVLILNMEDEARKMNLSINIEELMSIFQVPILSFNGRTGEGKTALFSLLANNEYHISPSREMLPIFEKTYHEWIDSGKIAKGVEGYREILLMNQKGGDVLSKQDPAHHSKDNSRTYNPIENQIKETFERLQLIDKKLKSVLTYGTNTVNKSLKLDRILVHPFFGPIIFFSIMLLVFQAIFSWAEYPMELIETGFSKASTFLQNQLPESWLTNLLTEGILAGIGGVAIFVPQIAILFFLLSILEESGYMARMVYLFDNLMQRFGLSGRSIVALISGGACAIPAIMSTRTISNWKERIITIMVTPLISCSARIPIYTIMIGLLIPYDHYIGWFNLKGIIFMALYLIGIFSALGLAWVLKSLIKSQEYSFLALDLPTYRIPLFKNIFFTVKDKVAAFVIEAGKIILMISIVLWFLASYGPPSSMELAEKNAVEKSQVMNLDQAESAELEASMRLEASYAGIFGKFIEPAIRPLGFDWKIGIALLTSFAAREVFVGTMATIYSIGSDEETSVRQNLAEAVDPDTGKKVYNFATVLSLLVFYIFAMQCMSTLAIVKRETASIKWPLIQFFGFTIVAYVLSLITFQIANGYL
jgi:ferrous iron transport protein B